MPEIFNKIDKIKPAYDLVYKAVMLICKLLLAAQLLADGVVNVVEADENAERIGGDLHACCRPLRFLYSRPGLE